MNTINNKQRDIVHILGGLAIGGIETWLINIFRSNQSLRDRAVILITGKKYSKKEGYYKEIISMGIPVFHIPFSALGLHFLFHVTRLFKKLKPAFVHSHMNFISGWYMLSAAIAKVPIRISHYHSTYPVEHKSVIRRLYIFLVRLLETMFSSHIIGCSKDALSSFPKRVFRKREIVLHCSIYLDSFNKKSIELKKRFEFGLPGSSIVLGHIGRFTHVKNHLFLLKIFKEYKSIHDDSYLVLIGDGELRNLVQHQAERIGLDKYIIFLHDRSDIPEIMLDVFDVLVFPSLYEGLGLVLIEAQASGIPIIISDVVPAEAIVVDRLAHILSLNDAPSLWAQAISESLHETNTSTSREEAFSLVSSSDFNIKIGNRKLQDFYDESLKSFKEK